MVKHRGKHEGTICYLKDKDMYMGKIQVGFRADGKPNRHSVYDKNKEVVRERMRMIAFNYGVGKCYDPSVMTLKEWILYWLEETMKANLKKTTYSVYKININTHIIPTLGHHTLKDLKAMHIQKFINDKRKSGLATGTLIKIKNILNKSLKQAYHNDMITKNPVEGIVMPKHKQKDTKVFDENEARRFEEAAKKDNLYELFMLAQDTGLRLGELLALTWKDINLIKGTVSVDKDVGIVENEDDDGKAKYIMEVQDTPKTPASVREVPLTKRCVELLKKYKQKSKGILVFSTRTGRYIQPGNVRRSFKRILNNAQIDDCATHTLRHNYASLLVDLGVTPKVVSELIGHSDVGFTLNVYVKNNPSKKLEATRMLDNYHLQSVGQ